MTREQLLADIKAKALSLLATIMAIIAKSAPLPAPQPLPQPTIPPAPPAGNKPTLNTLMLAMRDFEGKPGDQNYRNNNPLNCRCSKVGYAPIYGTVFCVRGFARFKTMDLGWLYAKNLLMQKIQHHPLWTLNELIGDPHDGWSPASDGNPVAQYVAFLAARLQVDAATFQIKKLIT